jgi:hypothetical protein
MATVAITVPGEAAIVAIANLIEVIAEGQSPEQRKLLWDRYIELTDPWHKIAVEVSKDIATFFGNVLNVKP